MGNIERRKEIVKTVKNFKSPISGNKLADKFQVSRQIIVQDIAILRAEGENIISTSQGYMYPNYQNKNLIKTIAVKHNLDRIDEELKIIIELGGKVIDIIVEHPIYGEITGNLMLGSMYDIKEFLKDFREKEALPLSKITSGIHLHTIEVPNEFIYDKILNRLKSKKLILEE
ncbi:MAG: transcription repressor NadR [Eubacteriaceae bacterium]